MQIHNYFHSLLLLTLTAASTSVVVGEGEPPHHTVTFFIHDVLGGSDPSAKAVTGIVVNPAVSGGKVPFAKSRGVNLPFSNGVPVDGENSGVVDNNNVPLLTGLSGTLGIAMQNSGDGRSGASTIDGQIPTGSSLRKLMYGTMTVIDDELTDGYELGSAVIGKAQGFYVVSGVDGKSQSMAFTAMFEAGDYEDSLSFFGVHRTAVSESHLAVMGGTGKYLDAKGFAVIKTFPATSLQHQTDGQETLLRCTIYLS